MLYLSALLLVIFAFVNVLGAWAVVRRRALISWLFMLAAATIMVSAVALVSALPFSRYLLAVGLILAWLASYLNALIVLGRVYPRNHFIRALVVIALYLLAHYSLPQA